MTRGSVATGKARAVRANGKLMILLSEIEQERIRSASSQRSATRFAQSLQFCFLLQSDARNLTPGPRGPGED